MSMDIRRLDHYRRMTSGAEWREWKSAEGNRANRERASVADAVHDAGSQDIGDTFEFAQLGMREIGACIGGRLALARHLNHADYFVVERNRRAHDFLNGFA